MTCANNYVFLPNVVSIDLIRGMHLQAVSKRIYIDHYNLQANQMSIIGNIFDL